MRAVQSIRRLREEEEGGSTCMCSRTALEECIDSDVATRGDNRADRHGARYGHDKQASREREARARCVIEPMSIAAHKARVFVGASHLT